MDGKMFGTPALILGAFLESRLCVVIAGLVVVGILAIFAVIGLLAWWVISHLQWVG